MSKPTLYTKGNLKVPNQDTDLSDEIPIEYISNWIKIRLPEFGDMLPTIDNRIAIIQSGTGSGKSTAMPVALYRLFRNISDKSNLYPNVKIVVTQPSIITTISIATDIESSSFNTDLKMGINIGYSTGIRKILPKKSGLVFCTLETILAQLKTSSDNEFMEMYKIIILDEVHIRRIQSDVLLMLLKNFYNRNVGNIKLPFLILTSATFDPMMYSNYFGSKSIMQVSGKNFPIEVTFASNSVQNYFIEAARLAIKIHEDNPDDIPSQCDILIFIAGKDGIDAIEKILHKYNFDYSEKHDKLGGDNQVNIEEHINILDTIDDNLDIISGGFQQKQPNKVKIYNNDIILPFFIIPIDGSAVGKESKEYDLINIPVDKLFVKAKRKVIISTSVAETGLTIDTLKYCIDPGYVKVTETYFPYCAHGLISRPIPKSSSDQRCGRVGRKFPGKYYPLMTKQTYDKLEKQKLPDIFTEGINAEYLSIIYEQQRHKLTISVKDKSIKPHFNIDDIDMLNLPSVENLWRVNYCANLYGFVSPNTESELTSGNFPKEKFYGLTNLGLLANKLSQLSMEQMAVIFAGFKYNVAIIDLITITSFFGSTYGRFFTNRKNGDINAIIDCCPDFLKVDLLTDNLAKSEDAIDNLIEDEPEIESKQDQPYNPKRESETSINDIIYFRTKFAIQDDFITMLLIFDKYLDIISGNYSEQTEFTWASKCGVKIANFIGRSGTLSKRAYTINNLLENGINAFHNYHLRLANTTIDNFRERIINIKKCIYAGLKINMLSFNKENYTYRNHQNLQIACRSYLHYPLAKQHNVKFNAKKIVTDQIQINSEMSLKNAYQLEANFISILDGFIPVNIDEFNPISLH